MRVSGQPDQRAALLLVFVAFIALIVAVGYLIFSEWLQPTTMNLALVGGGTFFYFGLAYWLPRPRKVVEETVATLPFPELLFILWALYLVCLPGAFLSRVLVDFVRQTTRPFPRE